MQYLGSFLKEIKFPYSYAPRKEVPNLERQY